MDAGVRLPSVWAFQLGGGKMEDKLRVPEPFVSVAVTGAFLIYKGGDAYCQIELDCFFEYGLFHLNSTILQHAERRHR